MRVLSDVATTTFAMLMFGVIVFIFIMLLPALVELKRSRVTEPRMILGDVFIQVSRAAYSI